MPYVFQEEINMPYPHQTGSEKFDSLYKLYEIFKNPSYFLVNLFFGSDEQRDLATICKFLKTTSEKYNVSNWVVRCEQKSEIKPLEAVAFSDILEQNHLMKCAEYIQQCLSRGYSCIVHEVINGQYPSNRLDWLYSFGIFYKNFLPTVEIYPATDASAIKWGKLSPLDLLKLDAEFNITHTAIRDEQSLKTYRQSKLNDWIQQFTKEIDDSYPNKKVFCNPKSLQKLLLKDGHPLFAIQKFDKAIQKTKQDLIDIALKHTLYAQEHNVDPNYTIIHGSLLFNYRMIVWDISTDKRWQHFDK